MRHRDTETQRERSIEQIRIEETVNLYGVRTFSITTLSITKFDTQYISKACSIAINIILSIEFNTIVVSVVILNVNMLIVVAPT